MLSSGLNVRLQRDDWLEMGFEVLRELGAGALTIDRLTDRLGVTKGSFYHHFANRELYSVALLEEWEDRLTGELIEASRRGSDFEERNRRLTRGGLEHFDPPLEMAIRAWALQDPIAREVQERVDRRRRAYLLELFSMLTEQHELAEELALIRYSFAVGAQQLLPPMDQSTYARLFARLEQQLEDAARMS